jgi:hypothetical protein
MGTTSIGRLESKIPKSCPSGTGRWTCTIEDGSHHQDEELAEEALGPVVGHVDQESHIGSGGDSSSDLKLGVNNSATMSTPTTTTSTTKENISISTRGHRRRASNEKSSGGNSGSSADERSSKSGGKNGKKKAASFGTHQERGGLVNLAAMDAPVAAREDGTRKEDGEKNDKARTNSIATMTDSPAKVILSTSTSSKVSDREQRSRRRQALSYDEIAYQQYFSEPHATLSATADTAASTKRSHGSSSYVGSDSHPPNKKVKMDGINPREGEVLKVKLLTGTLFLYRGPHRRVAFVPKY